MSRGRGVLVALSVVGVITVVAMATTVVAVWRAGWIVVDVREARLDGGDRIGVRVPAALVEAVVRCVPDKAFAEARGEAEQWAPVAQAACRELQRCPDAVLVDVSGAGETVLVAKQGGRLVIRVDSDGDMVHVDMPLGTVAAVLKRLS